MRIIDSHFHWWPRSIFEKLCKRQGYPQARVNNTGFGNQFTTDGGNRRIFLSLRYLF